MAIEIIDILGQKNNGEFPLVDSNDIRGGFYQVDTIEERNLIPSVRRKEGMLCAVKSDNIYQLVGGIDNSNWTVFNSGSGEGFSGEYDDLINKPYIPKNVSDLVNDSGFITIDDLDTSQNHTHGNFSTLEKITEEKITSWDNKSDFDGDYNNLTNKPEIPNIEDLATKEELETLETTLNEHLENHPNGEFPTDLGQFSLFISPKDLNSDVPFVIIKDGSTLKLSSNLSFGGSWSSLIGYYLQGNVNSLDFSGCSYFNVSFGFNPQYLSKPIYTNSKSIADSFLTVEGFTSDDIVMLNMDELITMQQVRGSSESISTYVGSSGQIVVNTDDNTVHVMDGVNAGGTKLARVEELENKANISDLENLATKEEVDEKISNIASEIEVEILDALNKKVDDIVLTDDNFLNFYANDVLIKSIKIEGSNVNFEEIEELKSTKIDDVVVETLEGITYIKLFANGVLLKSIEIETGVDIPIYVGLEEPVDDNYEVWIDTSDNEEFSSKIEDSLVDEIKSIISSLQSEINTLKKIVVAHEARIEYLELNGGGSSGGSGGEDEDNSGTATKFIPLTFEGGEFLILEDETILTFEDLNY